VKYSVHADCMFRIPPARFLLCLTVALAAHAATLGGIAGTASDAEGRQIRQGQIQLNNLISGDKIAGTIGSNGSYTFANVPAGSYYLTAQAEGYRPLVSKAVTVRGGDLTLLDLIFQKDPSWWSNISGVVAAIWGLGVSLVAAIFWPRIRDYMNRPKLRLDIRAEAPYSHWINPQFPEPDKQATPGRSDESQETVDYKPIDIYFSRLMIRNGGKAEAESVEVSVRRVFQLNADNNWVAYERFVPLSLRWSNTWDIVKAGDDVPGESRILAKDRISAGGMRLCDLGFIVDPNLYAEFSRRVQLRDRQRPTPGGDSCLRFHLAFEFIRDHDRHCLSSGTHLLEIVADALRIHPESFWVKLQIPAALTPPENEAEREKGLPEFRVECLDQRPPGIKAT
jgi:Carboxypeptidase regulatory-like domain